MDATASLSLSRHEIALLIVALKYALHPDRKTEQLALIQKLENAHVKT